MTDFSRVKKTRCGPTASSKKLVVYFILPERDILDPHKGRVFRIDFLHLNKSNHTRQINTNHKLNDSADTEP